MEKFDFEIFVEENNLDVSKDFSIPIQKQVTIFNELREKREDTIGDDRKEVDKAMKERALKILSDMESEMEDRLANNEVVEVEEPKPEPKPEPKKEEPKPEPKPEPKKEAPKPKYKKGDNVEIIGGNPKYIGTVAEVVEHYPESGKDKEAVLVKAIELPDGKTLCTLDLVKPTTKTPTKLTEDEKIIEHFFKQGIYRVGRSELKEKGFKGKLEDKEIQVGKYQLSKFRFSYNYAIKIKKK